MKKKNSKSKTLINVSHPDIITGVQGPTKIFRVFDIRYDTDGHRVPGLPKELFFKTDADIDPDSDLGDYISNQTGFCHYGYNWEEVKEAVPANAGYTITELLIAIFIVFMAILVLAAIVFGGITLHHFIMKYW